MEWQWLLKCSPRPHYIIARFSRVLYECILYRGVGPHSERGQRTDITWKHRSRVKIWQDFGVVGTPATDNAGSIRVYAHSAETRSSAPTAIMLRQRGQREGNIWRAEKL